MQARDVMTTPVVTVGARTEVREIAKRLLERGISAVPVVDAKGQVLGIVSEGDLMRRHESGTERRRSWWLSLLADPEEQAHEYIKSHGLHATDVMTTEVVTVPEDASLQEIATTLEKHRIKRVPVMSDGKPVGIVSRANLLHGFAMSESAAVPSRDDRETRKVLMASIAEAGVRAEFLNVTVSGGVAHLWGAVQSEEERHAVRVVIETTPGVRGVDDHLGVFPRSVRATLWAE